MRWKEGRNIAEIVKQKWKTVEKKKSTKTETNENRNEKSRNIEKNRKAEIKNGEEKSTIAEKEKGKQK